ncbi:MAG: hypothetical protein JNL80_00305 [Phycisphaerae bacterium]|nr:hypothetical protein [Phycisphaerae bacterium]
MTTPVTITRPFRMTAVGLSALIATGVIPASAACPPGGEASIVQTNEQALKELHSKLDPSGKPVCVNSPSSTSAIVDVPPPAGADPTYAREPLPRRGSVIDVAADIKRIKRQHFGSVRSQELRREGIERLKAFREPSSITAMYEELRAERDDVVLGMLDHVATLGESGQAALTWMAIMDENPALRHEATSRIHQPASPAALGVLDAAIRSDHHVVANRAGSLAGAIAATPLVPLLIAAQTTERSVEETGDLAWIAIGTQRSYVANVVPVTGDSSGAFQPIIGVINEGAVLRIMDAVVVSYRTEIHTSLVGLTSADWGKSTEYLGYDRMAWQRWYAEEYKPALARREAEAARVARAKQLEREAASEEE